MHTPRPRASLWARGRKVALAFLIVASLAFQAPSAEAAAPSPEVAAAIHYAAQEWGVSEAAMVKVSRCESHWNPAATNGSHDGLFQHKRKSWAGRVKAFLDHVRLHNQRHPEQQLPEMAGDRWSAIDNARLTAAYVAGVLPGYRGGWSWWSCKP